MYQHRQKPLVLPPESRRRRISRDHSRNPPENDAENLEATIYNSGCEISGLEITGAVNDFVRDALRHYPDLSEDLVRVVVVHPGDFLLPELGEELGNYAERKLRERKVKVIKHAHVASYDGSFVVLSDGSSIAAETLIWTAGVKSSPVIELLP